MRQAKNGILGDIENISLTEDMKMVVNDVYLDLSMPSARKSNRKHAVCFAIYQAHMNMGEPLDMPIIAKMVGVPSKDADRAINKFWPKLRTKGAHKSRYMSTERLIECYCRCDSIGLKDEHIESIKSDYKSYSPELKELYKERLLVAATVWNFIVANVRDNTIEEESFCALFGYRPNTVKIACKEILNYCVESGGK